MSDTPTEEVADAVGSIVANNDADADAAANAAEAEINRQMPDTPTETIRTEQTRANTLEAAADVLEGSGNDPTRTRGANAAAAYDRAFDAAMQVVVNNPDAPADLVREVDALLEPVRRRRRDRIVGRIRTVVAETTEGEL